MHLKDRRVYIKIRSPHTGIFEFSFLYSRYVKLIVYSLLTNMDKCLPPSVTLKCFDLVFVSFKADVEIGVAVWGFE